MQHWCSLQWCWSGRYGKGTTPPTPPNTTPPTPPHATQPPPGCQCALPGKMALVDALPHYPNTHCPRRYAPFSLSSPSLRCYALRSGRYRFRWSASGTGCPPARWGPLVGAHRNRNRPTSLLVPLGSTPAPPYPHVSVRVCRAGLADFIPRHAPHPRLSVQASLLTRVE